MYKRRYFSIEIWEVFSKLYVKVYFLDDFIVKDVKEVVERLNVVKIVSIILSNSKDYFGNILIVCLKLMV